MLDSTFDLTLPIIWKRIGILGPKLPSKGIFVAWPKGTKKAPRA